MSSPTLRLYCFGRILKAQFQESRGGDKVRSAIVLTPTAEGSDDQPFQVIACSTKIREYPSPFNVQIPGGRFRGVDEDVVAVHDWVRTIVAFNVREVGGLLSPKYTSLIITKLREFQAAGS